MTRDQYFETLQKSERPVIVEFWAPWCRPCKVMAPQLKRVSAAYSGKVDLIKINADEAPDVVKATRVMSIPAMIAYQNGVEIFRKVGMQSEEALQAIFEAALQVEPPRPSVQPVDRWLRGLSGVALTAIGVATGPTLLLVILGAVLLFSAVYDRCPIYRAISERLRRAFGQSS